MDLECNCTVYTSGVTNALPNASPSVDRGNCSVKQK